MAVCIGRGVYYCHDDCVVHRFGPQPGAFLNVDEVAEREGRIALGFVEWPDDLYAATEFLKVTPPREMIEQERKVEVPA